MTYSSPNKPTIPEYLLASNAIEDNLIEMPEWKLLRYNLLVAIRSAKRDKCPHDTFWLFCDDDARLYGFKWSCESLGYDTKEVRRKLADEWESLDFKHVRLTRYPGHAKSDPVSKYFDE